MGGPEDEQNWGASCETPKESTMKLDLKNVLRAKLLGSLASVLLLDSVLRSRLLMCPDGNRNFPTFLTVWRVNKT